MILVALPLATLASASRLRMASTLSLGMASFSRRMASALAFCTAKMACASPQLQNALLFHGIGAQNGSFLFALGGGDGSLLFAVSFRMTARFSRSAFICFSMAS